MGSNYLKARATLRRQLFLVLIFPDIPGTHFMDLERMKG